MSPPPSIFIAAQPVPPPQLRALVAAWFGDMVKLVVDVRLGVVAVGGELHADAEQLLLEQGSQQDNPSMEIVDAGVCDRVRQVVLCLVGQGEAL